MAYDEGERYNLEIKQGATWSRVFYYREEDESTVVTLTGYTGRAQIRDYPGGPLQAEFTVSVNGAAGSVTLSLTATQTKTLKKKGVYDLELVSGDSVIAFLRGDTVLIPEVTLP